MKISMITGLFVTMVGIRVVAAEKEIDRVRCIRASELSGHYVYKKGDISVMRLPALNFTEQRPHQHYLELGDYCGWRGNKPDDAQTFSQEEAEKTYKRFQIEFNKQAHNIVEEELGDEIPVVKQKSNSKSCCVIIKNMILNCFIKNN